MFSADYFVTRSHVLAVKCHVSRVGGDTLVTLLVIVLSRQTEQSSDESL